MLEQILSDLSDKYNIMVDFFDEYQAENDATILGEFYSLPFRNSVHRDFKDEDTLKIIKRNILLNIRLFTKMDILEEFENEACTVFAILHEFGHVLDCEKAPSRYEFRRRINQELYEYRMYCHNNGLKTATLKRQEYYATRVPLEKFANEFAAKHFINYMRGVIR